MQRYITLENSQICDLPTGEFTVQSITENAVVLMGEHCGIPPLELQRGETECLTDFDLTYMEHFEEGAHIKIESKRPFRASEMTVGEYDDNHTLRASLVVVVTHV